MIRTEELNFLRTAINLHCIEEGMFPISDGNFVTNWVDLYPLTCNREMLNKMVTSLATKIFSRSWKFEYVAGKELHGALLASSLVTNNKWMESDTIVVRKSEGVKLPYSCLWSSNCILVDDVISAGVNMLSSIEEIQKNGLGVTGVICVVYREGGAKEIAESRGIPFDYLFSITEDVIPGELV